MALGLTLKVQTRAQRRGIYATKSGVLKRTHEAISRSPVDAGLFECS
jgi:hypothetical protein